MGDNENKYKKLPQIIAALGAAMGGFNIGTALGWTSGSLILIQMIRGEEDASSDAWIESTLYLGAIISLVVASFIMDVLGRKWSLIISLPLAAGSWVVTALVVIDPVQIAMRFGIGLAIGIHAMLSPVYVGETVAKEIRGALGFFFQIMLNLGILYSYIVALSEDIILLSMLMIVPVLTMVIWVIFLPESPYFLMSKGKEEAARDALQRLRGRTYNIDKEFLEIQNVVEQSKTTGRTTLLSVLRRKAQRRAFGVGILLMSCSQFSGINAVLFNLTSIFEAAAGHKEHAMKSSLLQSIFVGVVQVVATVPAMFVVDLLGRRLLMMASMFAMGVGQALLFVYFLLEELWGDSLAPGLGWLPPVGLVLFIASFSVGPGPISMAMLGEIFSEDAKSVSAPAATIFDFILSFFVVWTYEYLAPVIALYVFFLVYAVCCFLGLVAIFFILPETKNRTFEEIQNILEGNAPHMAPLLFRS